MKEITLPLIQTFSLTIDTHALDFTKTVDFGGGRRGIPLGNVVDTQAFEQMRIARANGGKIVHAAIEIENQLGAVLLTYFMGPFVGRDERRDMFEREILQSSVLSYSAKKELFSKAVNSGGLLAGKKKSAAQSHLKKIMEWRNAFAHGKIQHDNPTGCFVRFHSGEQRHIFLTDDYWDDVEETFGQCSKLLKEALDTLLERTKTDSAPAPEVG
jgi:hypothetical protein